MPTIPHHTLAHAWVLTACSYLGLEEPSQQGLFEVCAVQPRPASSSQRMGLRSGASEVTIQGAAAAASGECWGLNLGPLVCFNPLLFFETRSSYGAQTGLQFCRSPPLHSQVQGLQACTTAWLSSFPLKESVRFMQSFKQTHRHQDPSSSFSGDCPPTEHPGFTDYTTL